MKFGLKIYVDFLAVLFAWSLGSVFAILFRYDFSVPFSTGIKLMPTISILTLTFYYYDILIEKFLVMQE